MRQICTCKFPISHYNVSRSSASKWQPKHNLANLIEFNFKKLRNSSKERRTQSRLGGTHHHRYVAPVLYPLRSMQPAILSHVTLEPKASHSMYQSQSHNTSLSRLCFQQVLLLATNSSKFRFVSGDIRLTLSVATQ